MINPVATTLITAAATATLCSSLQTHAIPAVSFTTRHVAGKTVRAHAVPLVALICTHKLNVSHFSFVKIQVFPILHVAHCVASPALLEIHCQPALVVSADQIHAVCPAFSAIVEPAEIFSLTMISLELVVSVTISHALSQELFVMPGGVDRDSVSVGCEAELSVFDDSQPMTGPNSMEPNNSETMFL